MITTSEAILKSDRRVGRQRHHAALHGVNYPILAGWIPKRKRPTSPIILRPPHPAALSLVKAEIQALPSDRVMELEDRCTDKLLGKPLKMNQLCATLYPATYTANH
jgi:hypothetical protein